MDVNEQLRALLSTLPIALWAIDRDGVITLSEGSLLRTLGVGPGELVGQSIFDVYKSFPQFIDVTRRALQGEAATWIAQIRGVTFESWYTPQRDDAGHVTGLIGVATDISERVRIEQQMRQAQKMEAVGRLAGGIAHDFNNLLTAIVGFADLTLKDLEPAHPVRRDVEEISAAGKSAVALTRQLLAFSRQQLLEPHVLDLNEVVSRMAPLLSRLIGENIDLQWRLATPLGAVYADPGQIDQVVLNLAINARDAMPGGGTLAIETADIELDRPYVMLAISDTGIGMDDAVKEHLFEPFYTTKEMGQGTGLGLATVYGIVKQSAGSIRVCSEAGHGTTIKVFLPRADRTEEVLTAPPAVPLTLLGDETVLVVEDHREVLSVAAETLRRHGYDVIEAASDAEALEAWRSRSRIHLLLTDAVMPGMSGRALAERFLRERPSARVLHMSGYIGGGAEQRELAAPGAAFIQKPFAPNTLLQKVREVLGTPRHSRERHVRRR
jgi:PAS domain S-box-containing protein